MNVQQFSSLSVGDKIENLASGGSKGEVSALDSTGVWIIWGVRHANEKPIHYSIQSTAWFQWSAVA